MPSKETDSYTCAICGGVFIKGLTDAASIAASIQEFGEAAMQGELAMFCDDCYPAFARWYHGLSQEARARMLREAGLP